MNHKYFFYCQDMQLEVDDPDQGNFSIDPTMATRHTIKKEKTKNKSIIRTHLF